MPFLRRSCLNRSATALENSSDCFSFNKLTSTLQKKDDACYYSSHMPTYFYICAFFIGLGAIASLLRANAKTVAAKEERELTEKQLQDELYAISKTLEKIRAYIEDGRNDKAVPHLIGVSEILGKFTSTRFSSLEWKEFCAAQNAEFQCLSEFLNENAKPEINGYLKQRETSRKQQELARKEAMRKRLVPTLALGTVATAVVVYVLIQVIGVWRG